MKSLTLDQLYGIYGSSESGLSVKEAESRLQQSGPNLLPVIESRSWVTKLTMQFVHFFAILLWTAAIISFAIGWADPESEMTPIGWAILIVIILNGLFGFFQEYRAEKSLEALRRILPVMVRVIRDDEERVIPGEELVLGDIVVLKEGDKIPADLYIIRAFDLWVNESTLSGESEPVSADFVGSAHPKTVLYSGTYVVKGEAAGLVFASGKDTKYGAIAALTQGIDSGEGHLQQQIRHISKMIAMTSFLIASSLVVLAEAEGFELWKTFLFALGLLVALIPEGLLPTVTLALAFGAQRMASKGFLVNGLSVIENLGSVTVIATDKTGTITQNKMQVRTWYEEGEASPSPALLDAAALCNRAGLDYGDPVDQALYLFAQNTIDVAHCREEVPLVEEYPFDYHLKRMTTVHRAETGFEVYCKGAPEVIMQICPKMLCGDRLLDESLMRDLIQHHDQMAAQGYRVIALAKKSCSLMPLSREEAEEGLNFIGFIGMIDPLREDIPEAIGLCHKAGIRVIMITGDHPVTAGAIGVNARIITSASEVTTGEQLEKLPPSALKRLLRKNHVFARVSPEQKLSLVTHLKEMGEIVAVTGDGVNDAPALKKADVGIAMGSGTDVAKQSSDAILLDDHFGTIVKGIEEGRAVYDNIRRFITYMLASNLPEAVPYVFFFWMGIPLALPVALVLAIDLGTDIVPGLALGAEQPHPGLMHKGPRSRKEAILTSQVYLRAFGYLGLFSAVISMGLFWIYLVQHGWNGGTLSWHDPLYLQATTVTFAAIVFAQIGNGLSCRSEHESLWKIGWWKNSYYWVGVAIEIVLLLALIYFPPFSKLFGTAPFDPLFWFPVIGTAVLLLAAEEIRKWILRQ